MTSGLQEYLRGVYRREPEVGVFARRMPPGIYLKSQDRACATFVVVTRLGPWRAIVGRT